MKNLFVTKVTSEFWEPETNIGKIQDKITADLSNGYTKALEDILKEHVEKCGFPYTVEFISKNVSGIRHTDDPFY